MRRREDESIFQRATARGLVLGALLFLSSVTLVTFSDVSAYLDRAASLKRSSRGPSFVQPTGPAVPHASPTPPAPSAVTRPPLLSSAAPPSVSTPVRRPPTAPSPGEGSAAAGRGQVHGMPLVYREQREENFGR
jgi:hypothetical protein